MRTVPSVVLLGLVLGATLADGVSAQRSNTHPLFQGLHPRGGRRGTEMTLQVYGRRLNNIQGIYQLEDGIELLEAKTLRNNRAQLRIKIREDCRLGTHRIALRTVWGVSNPKTFYVGVLPEVFEKEPNNSLQQAQPVKLDVTINGMIRSEDNDYFRIEVKAGQRVNFEVEGLRLADLEFDPYLRILDAKGNVLAQLDDSSFALFDPCGSHVFKEAGVCFVHVRETAFGGSNNSHYRLHIGGFPRPTVAFPPGGRPGELLKTTLIGPDGQRQVEIQLPSQPDPRHRHHVETEAGTSPTPIFLCVDDLPAQLEPGLQVPPAVPVKRATIGPWYFLGPFANWRNKQGKAAGHDKVYPPEEQTNLPRLPLKTDFKGRDGVIRWKRLGGVRDDRVFDLRRVASKPNGSAVFLHREIQSPSKRRTLFLFAGDDTLKVWLNGKQVHKSKSRRATANAQRLFLTLDKGRNQLLLKLTNESGGFGFQARILEPGRDDRMFLSAPLAVHGILSKAGESDRFRFHATKGQRLNIQAVARRLRSPLDAVLHVTSSTDRFYAGSDDVGRDMDGLVRFKAPHTGEFNLTIVDRLGRGGADYVYRLEIQKPKRRPAYTRIAVPGQPDTWTVSVPQGGRMTTLISTRDLRSHGLLELLGLPEGVTATVPGLQRGVNVVPVLLAASNDAPLAGALCPLTAKNAKGQGIDAGFKQPVTLVRARNNTPFLSTLVERLPVAVTKRSPFRVELTAPKVALVRGSPMRLQVRVLRAKGYTQRVRLRLLYNPPGVTANQTNVAAGKDRGYLYLNARGNARIGSVPIAVVGLGNVAGGSFESSSLLVNLRVAAPLIQAKIGRVRATQGQKAQLAVEFTKAKGFAGSCRLQLVNLPKGITASTPEIGPDTKKVMVDLALDRRAPPGRHRNFRLRLQVPSKNGPMLHEYRGGEIRVDRAKARKGL